MNTLTLAPDEVLPQTPAPLEGEALGPVTLSLHGEKREFWFRVVELLPRKYVVFAREVENEDAGNWVVYNREVFTAAMHLTTPWKKKLETAVWKWNPQTHALGRVFFAPIQGRNRSARILLGEDGTGIWLRPNLLGTEAAQFHYQQFQNRVEQIAQLKRDLSNCDSTLCFTARWERLDLEAQHKMILGENLTQIEHALRWGVLSQSALWESADVWIWNLNPLNSRPKEESELFPLEGSYSENHIKQFPFLLQIAKFLNQNYIPRITATWREHLCVRHLMNSPFFRLGVEVEGPPTAHEQIEAAFELIQWLRENHAPGEIEALLPG